MAYIYQIKNKLNGKIYVGKTNNTIENRWKEHCQDFKKEKNEKEIKEITGYDQNTIKVALENKNVSAIERQKRGREKISKVIAMLDKDTKEIIKVFPSMKEAYIFLGKDPYHTASISYVCNGKRKTAYGYSWKYI